MPRQRVLGNKPVKVNNASRLPFVHMQTLGWYSAFCMRNESKADKLASHNKVGSRRGA